MTMTADTIRRALNHYADQAEDLGPALTAQAVFKWNSLIHTRLLELVEGVQAQIYEQEDGAAQEVEAIEAVLVTGALLKLALDRADELSPELREAMATWALAMGALAAAFPELAEALAADPDEDQADEDQADEDQADEDHAADPLNWSQE